MRRVRGVDPLWRARGGAEHRTDHLFAARPAEGTRVVRVEARDPWGEVHAAELRL